MNNLLIFSGSARNGNFTQHVADFVNQVASQYAEINSEVVSPESLGLKLEDEADGDKYPELKTKVANADGFILVTPEYNHGYPGSLKLMLDLNLKEYIHKPVAFVGISSGPWGGTRVIESLLNPVRELGMVATFTDLNVTHVKNEVQDGEFIEAEAWKQRTIKMLDELVWMSSALKDAREKK